MAEEKILRCSPEEAVATGAHALFFPHGVGHLLGLDVHDLEQFGDRAAYPRSRTRSSQFGLSYLRLDLDLQAGHLVTIEPGFYAVPAILLDPELVRKHRKRIDFDRAQSWLGLGGIRIEDDILVTADGPRSLTGTIPRTIAELEEAVGCGLSPAERFGT
jgi:Xaa-Pro aminopeptidase